MVAKEGGIGTIHVKGGCPSLIAAMPRSGSYQLKVDFETVIDDQWSRPQKSGSKRSVILKKRLNDLRGDQRGKKCVLLFGMRTPERSDCYSQGHRAH